jgi:hypothetical protein
MVKQRIREKTLFVDGYKGGDMVNGEREYMHKVRGAQRALPDSSETELCLPSFKITIRRGR